MSSHEWDWNILSGTFIYPVLCLVFKKASPLRFLAVVEVLPCASPVALLAEWPVLPPAGCLPPTAGRAADSRLAVAAADLAVVVLQRSTHVLDCRIYPDTHVRQCRSEPAAFRPAGC